METNLAMDDDLLEQARQIGGHRTKKAAVIEALQEYVQRHHLQEKHAETGSALGIKEASEDPSAPISSDIDAALHEEARSLARLLVREIKLYNEEVIEEGRRVGDIYSRLKEDIDRSCQMYKARIDPRVQEDYFHQELVQILAGGDPKLLCGKPGKPVSLAAFVRGLFRRGEGLGSF